MTLKEKLLAIKFELKSIDEKNMTKTEKRIWNIVKDIK